MKYKSIRKAVFLERINRFVAMIEIDGKTEKCHVKNTGRCKELLLPNIPIYVQESNKPGRKTGYDLISVQQTERIVNIDSQIPNALVKEFLEKTAYFSEAQSIKMEKKFGSSRFDLYVEAGQRKIFIEVKGVTLDVGGTARFPDAPTERGVRHLNELMKCIQEGYEAYLFFVIQMKGPKVLEPNWQTHPQFAQTLLKARESGVRIIAYDCTVAESSIEISEPIPVKIAEKSDFSVDGHGK